MHVSVSIQIGEGEGAMTAQSLDKLAEDVLSLLGGEVGVDSCGISISASGSSVAPPPAALTEEA